MKKVLWFLAIFFTTSVLTDSVYAQEPEKSNRQKVIELLKSIETGDIEAISYINPDKYIQHNQKVGDGLDGLTEVLKKITPGSVKVNTVRAFEDGDYVFTHTEYFFFGPKVSFDIFKFEDGLIVSHWDNLQKIAPRSVSGNSQVDGETVIKDREKTSINMEIVQNYVNDVLKGNHLYRITNYISTEKYIQHNPAIANGVKAFEETLQALNDAGMPMVYKKTHIILGEGNFVLAVSEGEFMKKRASFYNLFRIEDGLIVEHWDTIEVILPKEDAKNDNGKFNFN